MIMALNVKTISLMGAPPKPKGRPRDPMLSKYAEEGILGAKPGAVKVDSRTEVTLKDLPALDEARAKEKEAQFLRAINAVREKVEEEYEQMKFTAKKNQMLVALSGIILPVGVGIGMYRSIGLINPAAIPVVICITAAGCFAFYVSHRIEERNLARAKEKLRHQNHLLDYVDYINYKIIGWTQEEVEKAYSPQFKESMRQLAADGSNEARIMHEALSKAK
jgi:hypothetical protein